MGLAATIVSIVARVMEAVFSIVDDLGKDLSPEELEKLRGEVLQGIQDRALRIAAQRAREWAIVRGAADDKTPEG